jgi:ribonuclease HII
MKAKAVLGVDEAGRGPLAGPVAVGAVCAPEGFDFLTEFPGLNDSKKLSEKKREALFARLVECTEAGTIQVAVVLKSAKEIDGRGIAVVIRDAVAEAVEKLLPDAKAGKVWLDGSLKAPIKYEQETVIGGDALIPAIMLASIAAKVSRDRHMVRLAAKYPEYGFEGHKGYGTKAHIQAIRERGLSDLHRLSFCKNFS